MIAAADGQLYEIVLLSLRVSLTAVAIATVVGLPLGAAPFNVAVEPMRIKLVSLAP